MPRDILDPAYLRHDLLDPAYLRQRVERKIDREGPTPTHDPSLGQCWMWTGQIRKRWPYGIICIGGRANKKTMPAHRLVYELYVGPIPEGLTLDHLCRNQTCVRPEHLDPCPLRENHARWVATLTHCRRGHEMTEANTYQHPNGQRGCRTCRKMTKRAWDESHREHVSATKRAWIKRTGPRGVA